MSLTSSSKKAMARFFQFFVFVLEKKVHYKKVFTEIGREPEDDYEWEHIDSCWGEYYEDSDELIKVALEENEIKLKETA